MLPPKPIYYTVHDWMVRDLNLKGGAERDVYALLYSLADKAGVAKVKQSYLVERLGYSEKTIRNAIQTLMDSGWLMKARADHHGINEYGVVEPATIIGRFEQVARTPEEITAVIGGTAVKTTAEQRQNLPVTAVKITGDTPYYIFDNNIYNNFFIPDVPSEKKEKEGLLEEFFLAYGLYQPMDEVMRFWAYHEQTDWRNGKGQKIVNKKAAAKFWTISEDVRRQSDLAKKIISKVMSVLPEVNKTCFISELEDVYMKSNNLVMHVQSGRLVDVLEGNDMVVAELSRSMYRFCGSGTRLSYAVG